MCGIVGYAGNRDATPILINGLKKLEYRGYDSAGICTIHSGSVEIRRSAGKIGNLEQLLTSSPLQGSIGIGHTRWATHGKPTESNAHPHKAGPVVVVHNGIIENYLSLKEDLESKGHVFRSETDSEVISHLVEEKLLSATSFEQAVRMALNELTGAYAICILSESAEKTLIAAKMGSPMVVGIRDDEFFVASDIPAILPHTREMIFMEDGEIALFRNGGVEFTTLEGKPVCKKTSHIDWSPLAAEKNGYPHFMLKEIHEQPQAVRNVLAGRLRRESGDVFLEGMKLDDTELRSFDRVTLVACGTSWHAALVGKYLIERHCRVPVEVDIASEYRYREPLVTPSTLVIPITQSGETADTLAALREAKKRNAAVVTICNAVDSSIAREADGVIYTNAGLEMGVASTKAFLSQLVALHLLTIRLGRARGTLGSDQGQEWLTALCSLPELMEETLRLEKKMEQIAGRYLHARDFLYLGRGQCYPLALEGALKLKEISYIHAEGYPAGEMKHGPIALIDKNMPVVILAPRDRHYEKIVSNMEEVIARGGRVIALCSDGDSEMAARAEEIVPIPRAPEMLSPLLLTVPLQFLAYHMAVLRGQDVDQPRNLAKSVTVE